jgi:glycosyltransferase involved in cell wall biosynthesis
MRDSEPMKSCMLSYSFYESDTRILQYTSALVGQGHAVDVIALRRRGSPEFEVLDGVHVNRIQYRAVDEQSRFCYLLRVLRFLIVAMWVLARNHWIKRYHVIHVHSVPDFLVFGAIIPKLLGARVILDIHDIMPEFYASKFAAGANSAIFKLLLLVEKVSISMADHVIIANDLWRERLISRSVSPAKCTSILNYPIHRIFHPRPKSDPNGRFLILYPGTLNRHQGVDIAVRAFSKVADQMPDAQFHIYGEGPSKQDLLALIETLGLTGRVIIRDFLPTNEIADVMATSDLAVVPKRASSLFGNEAASTKIAEFMSLGVPLIVSRTKVDTFYYDDSLVKFFESENELDLAECMLLLWRDRELRARLAANASRYIRESGWQEKQHGYLRMVQSLALPALERQNA